jgi:phospholipase/lecithinase/hemolysin
VPNLLEQVEDFARSAAAEPAADPATDGTAGALVVLRAGANDYLDSGPSSAVAEAVNRHLLAAVDSLAARGFRRFLLPSELPWGFSPIQQPGFDGAARAGLNALIANQNAALGQALAARAAQGPLYIWQPDFHGLLLAVRADPTAFGFATVEAPVLSAEAAAAGAGGLAPPSAGFLWWDWGHFTTAFHSLLAQEAWSCLVGTTACDRPSAGSSVSWDPQGRRIWGAGSQRSPGSLS